MEIQKITNNQYHKNISHKAYFKYNSTLKELCKKAPQNEKLTNLVDRFKNTLPNQELRITKTIIITPPYPLKNSKNFYRVINSVTNKSVDIKVPLDNRDLNILLSEIYRLKEKLFSNCEESCVNYKSNNIENLYKELTTRHK